MTETVASQLSDHLQHDHAAEPLRAATARTVNPLSFAGFKANPAAQAMFRKLGLEDLLLAAPSWRSLRTLVVRFNDCDQGHFVKLVQDCDGVCSSGERVLLHAIAAVCDFAWLADYLAGVEATPVPFGDGHRKVRGCTWRDMDRVGGDHLRAVAACILAAGA